MKTITSWSKQIANNTQLAASMPKWYARTTIVDFDKAKLDDQYMDLSKGTTYQVGDQIMFISCDDFESNLENNSGLLYTVAQVTSNGHVKFEQGYPIGQGLHFGVLFLKNPGFEVSDLENVATSLQPDARFAMVPITIQMIEADQKTENRPLRSLGFRGPGWYKWRQITRHHQQDETPTYKTQVELVVSLKDFHSPSTTSGSAGQIFQPAEGGLDGEITFNDEGEIVLG